MKKRIEDYPIVVLESIESAFSEIRNLIKAEYELVEEVESSEIGQMVVKGRKLSKFFFKIVSANLDGNKNRTVFKIERKPANDKDVNDGTLSAATENTVGNFKQWLHTLKRYNNINYRDELIENYEEEHFKVLKILDDDANTSPFDLKQQIGINRYLELIERHIEENDNEYNEIILKEITEAKVDLNQAPKNIVMKKIGRIWGYARKYNLNLFKEFVSVFKKEVMKKTLWEGVEKVNEIFDLFKGLLE